MSEPVSTTEFWRNRLAKAHASGRGLHTAIYDTDEVTWDTMQNETKGIIHRHIMPGCKVLDVGCGYGALAELMPERTTYVGVDLSPDLIEIACLRRPDLNLVLANATALPFKAKEFDVAVARSLKGMIQENLGDGAWQPIESELIRVARTVLVMEYGGDYTFRVYPSS